MKHFNLFSAIALFCLAAGFVSCTKTGNENPNVEQDEEILFVIDEATDKANPEIREGLVRCGFIVEVCNPSKPDVLVLGAGSAALYFIGDGFSEEVVIGNFACTIFGKVKCTVFRKVKCTS